MIDLQTVRNTYASFEVNNVVLIRSDFTVAHALKKIEINSVLLESITAGKSVHPVEQWIICAKIKEILADKRERVSVV